MNIPSLNQALSNVIYHPTNAKYNFLLGIEYEKLGQTTSAFSYFLRTAEFSTDTLLSYEALLHNALCLEKQGDRNYSLKGLLWRIIALMPERPEAYFILGRIYQNTKEWPECYGISSIGETKAKNNVPRLSTDVGYCGTYLCSFQKSVAAWYVGLYYESIGILKGLKYNELLSEPYLSAVNNNLNAYGNIWRRRIIYYGYMYPDLKWKFDGSENIKENFSQCYQDVFVLTALHGKRNGKFVEIGCNDATWNSNTWLLEKDFGWSGISIDIDPKITEEFAKKRKSQVITGNAVTMDYEVFLVEDDYDYLQVDCEPAENTLHALQQIKLEKHKFAVITFEHERYNEPHSEIQDMARKHLESYGYKLVIDNISEDDYSPFEDWYVHPDMVDSWIIRDLTHVNGKTKRADKLFLNR